MRVLLLVLLAAAAPARAADNDAAALSLADTAPAIFRTASDWRVFATGAWSHSSLRDGAGSQNDEHLFTGVHFDRTFAPGWRVTFKDLLDVHWHDAVSHQDAVNTVVDAYLSWQPHPDRIADVGRINTRYGVGFGYNPTDYFRANATRSIISIDPESLRQNRQGSVMLRGQALWASGSLTALYSPQLANQPTDNGFSPRISAPPTPATAGLLP